MLRASHVVSATVLACLAAVVSPAALGAPLTITGTATDLPNTTAADLWRFDFSIDGQLATGDVLDIGLAPGLFDHVTLLTPALPGYTVQLLSNPSGATTGLRLMDTGSTSSFSELSVSTELKSHGRPFPFDQRFNAVYNPMAGLPSTTNFTVHMAPVPEPATLSMFAMGLLGLGLTRRKRKA